MRRPTHCGNDLSLNTELVGKPTSKVADAPAAVVGHVWDISDAIEHLPTGEEQHKDETDRGPQVTVSDHR